MIDLNTASRLLDFGARIGDGPRAQDQLKGAVAIHNILSERGVAYLADEVGMGKTYVALGALALFRHYQPNFRVLIIAPRENIQTKWMKEFRNFLTNNVRFRDLRVKALDGLPARPMVACNNLIDLVHQVMVDPNRDFFMRLTSFSLPVSGKDTVDPSVARRHRDELRRHLPWMSDEVFDLRHKQAFKDNMARALCCALPRFDLVIVDEAHNLKHGFSEHVSARNRILALAMGRPGEVNDKLFPGFGSRAARVLFLSATPVEETYRHLWNQLDVFGRSNSFDGLRNPDLEDDAKKAIAGEFLVRRVTKIQVGQNDYTKNLYRREWRRGGLHVHDEPIRIDDPKQRLVVALVQKKVSELLGHERFNSSFQIGMLASFESFLETTRIKGADPEAGNFDDSEQTDNLDEREGIDVADVNRLSRSYYRKFGVEMPHPKMDAIVDALSNAWRRGEKSLIFVRRVASVKELKKKLDECYDEWLMGRLLDELPVALHPRLEDVFRQYRDEKLEAESTSRQPSVEKMDPGEPHPDQGGKDSFFAWFFRGEGPRGVISGANIQQRFIQSGAAYGTFFEDNYVAEVLGCGPGQVEEHLAQALHVEKSVLRKGLVQKSKRFLSRAVRQQRADRFEAIQAAAIEWLKERPGPHREIARVIWHERFESSIRSPHAEEAPDSGNLLELPTFFTALREREELRTALWPRSREADLRAAFREQELRAQLLASAARLGHPLIDLYVMTVTRLGSLELRAQESGDDESSSIETQRIAEFLDLLEKQMNEPRQERDWNSFDELSDIAANFDLLLDANAPEARSKPLTEMASYFGKQLLRGQQPVGGMSGQVNQTLVRQFRMPGYPLVLVTTDLLQEGEDLHTFCSSVHHYGIAWTPSSMEQRIGRVDRVRSLTERRLRGIQNREPLPEELLQVYFPHLEDTVEVLQVQRVLERMNLFMRLMHDGLTTATSEERSIDAEKEFVRGHRVVEPIRGLLESAFPTKREHLVGAMRELAVCRSVARELGSRFARLRQETISDVDIIWEKETSNGLLFGTANLGMRVQPFKLIMRSVDRRLAVRCISPVGCVSPGEDQERIVASAAVVPIWIGAVETRDNQTYDLTVEGEVLLDSSGETDAARVGTLVSRIVHQADTLEQKYLPGRDEALAKFHEELLQEVSHGR